MTGRSGPSAFFETLSGGTGPSPIFSQALAEDKKHGQLLKAVSWGTKPSLFFSYAVLLNDSSVNNCLDVRLAWTKCIFSHFWSRGVPHAPRAPRAPARPQDPIFIDVRTSPARFLRPFGVTLGVLWRPSATLGRTSGRPGTQKSGCGTALGVQRGQQCDSGPSRGGLMS